ncbi:DNA/RNA helicase [Mycolicibacterium thermoresistibile]|uniref:ATP-dependent RNA helicase n=1 Tax=Mycolicibacterium thermoresistibile TaxID=1797 RepID=A0A100XBM5_MYCTH|nr:ATP-dependent RNA helicase [Mycolicibacterium thermoresistibile]SNW17204.1 DNA/RNA helicase [Mycolicibacterium thermoresistibile]
MSVHDTPGTAVPTPAGPTPAGPTPPGPTPTVTFAELDLPAAVVTALADAGVHTPFPIQAATLPDSLTGRDVLGRGRTGSGKSYAFLLPVVARLARQPRTRTPRRPRALILAPTRELVTQLATALAPLAAVTGLRSVTVFGGVGAQPQIQRLRAGVDIVLACPGRLEDLMSSGHVDLSGVEITVLDEADHMADLGFLPGVKRLLDRTPRDGQRLLFSATLDAGVDVLVRRYLDDPVVHSVDSEQSPVTDMAHHVLHVQPSARIDVLTDLAAAPGRTIVFARTKHGAKKLARQLNSRGVRAVELHGNLAQNARTRNLTAFADGSATVLVATDIAARGIHVDDVGLVVHADPPVEHKAYLHRSGRTARAGASGTVVTLMLDDQVSDVRALTRKAGVKPVITRFTGPQHPVLHQIAPGERIFTTPIGTAPPGTAPAGTDRPRRPRPAARAGVAGDGRARRPRRRATRPSLTR